MFIAIEGNDAAGKHTQTELLYNYLSEKEPTIKTEEPTKGPIGALAVQILNKGGHFDAATLQVLFSADRHWEYREQIEPALSAGKNVVADRFKASTKVYGVAADLDNEWLENLNADLPNPDITFILDIDMKTIEERIHKRSVADNRPKDMHEKQLNFLGKVRDAYLAYQKEHKYVFLIDGSKSIEEVHGEIVKIVESHRDHSRIGSKT